MVREDLIEGAISFLQDPSVASAPLEQRIAFLRSKNLTQDEIDTSLARVGSPPAAPQSSQAPAQYQPQYRQSPQQYGYQQPPYWAQQPPEPPRRDWRDWFIMATVVSGIGYAAYWTAKRYVYPIVAPPTPPQLEQDKAQVDEAFKQAFDLLEQLSKDTNELKEAESARKQRLDAALSEVESVIAKMKDANETRELEAKRMARELSDIQDQIPKAIEKETEHTNSRLRELTDEMKSLKTLVGNRMSGGGGGQPQRAPAPFTPQAQTLPTQHVNGSAQPAPSAAAHTDPNAAAGNGAASESEKAAAPGSRAGMSTPYGRTLGGGRAAIPEWQLAAKKRKEDAAAAAASVKEDSAPGTPAGQDLAASGTVTEAS